MAFNKFQTFSYWSTKSRILVVTFIIVQGSLRSDELLIIFEFSNLVNRHTHVVNRLTTFKGVL